MPGWSHDHHIVWYVYFVDGWHMRMRSSLVRMRSSLVVRASDCQCISCNGPGFDPSIRRHSGIWGAADEPVLNTVPNKKKHQKTPCWLLCNTYNIIVIYFRIFLKIFLGDFFLVLYSAHLHLPPLRFHCADGCWDQTQVPCNWCIGSQTL